MERREEAGQTERGRKREEGGRNRSREDERKEGSERMAGKGETNYALKNEIASYP